MAWPCAFALASIYISRRQLGLLLLVHSIQVPFESKEILEELPPECDYHTCPIIALVRATREERYI